MMFALLSLSTFVFPFCFSANAVPDNEILAIPAAGTILNTEILRVRVQYLTKRSTSS